MDKPISFEKLNLSSKKPDRVRVGVSAFAYSAYVSGVPFKEFCLDPQKAMDLQLWVYDLHKIDGKPSYSIPHWGGWDFGGELLFPSSPKYANPYLVKRPVNNANDIQKLEIPKIQMAPFASRKFKFSKISIDKGFGVSLPAGSPLGITGSILGPELLLRWFHKEPSLVHHILRLSTDYILEISRELIKEFGAENCSAFSTYPWECHSLVSPIIFEKFSLPYVIEIHKTLIQLGIKKWVIHLCGDHKKNLCYWVNEIPLLSGTVFTIGHEMDIKETADIFGEQCIIGGNLSTSLLQMGNPQQVFLEAGAILKKMMHNPEGFILMPSCTISPTTPPVNLHAMIKAAREFKL
ncbi:uroporphyrinogen decarboxylase family protein [Candidatus Contubernalis alkaliaceticus]|uniref:uroporphyrinogen decarboxylase family protein n=1 Tax=Candidatus Contubernalis alkaliaceticus TaxID=338645 RepID=UPI001F4C44D2|nr:uroporphyrinogen decarboxylase family protein [Candidatus Contubernalis alkalaceticus]UNC90841.1 hypothetical protein HUE98_01320 [Candidatus Contubernalis alkalaceticus]